jgi:hypothetical protein
VPSTVHIHVESEARFFSESPDFLELCRLPLEAGQKYLVQASGIAGVDAGVMMRLKLDVCGRAGNVIASQQADYINDHQQFLLVVAEGSPQRGGAGSGPGPSANPLGQVLLADAPQPEPVRLHQRDDDRGGDGRQDRPGLAYDSLPS